MAALPPILASVLPDAVVQWHWKDGYDAHQIVGDNEDTIFEIFNTIILQDGFALMI